MPLGLRLDWCSSLHLIWHLILHCSLVGVDTAVPRKLEDKLLDESVDSFYCNVESAMNRIETPYMDIDGPL